MESSHRRVVKTALFLLSVATLASAEGQEDDPRRSILCQRGYSASLRLPYAEYRVMRDAAFARAGIPVSQQCHKDDARTECYRVDHRLPLELCLPTDNCNNLSNIQIQRRDEAATKDKLENEMHRRYCEGKISLSKAQAVFK